jgi:hypothetical protein
MRSLVLSLMLIFSYFCSASTTTADTKNLNLTDPDLIDPEMATVMYLIKPRDIKTTAYQSGLPASFDLKLCRTCQIKSYTLKAGAELLINEQPLAIDDLTIQLIKKKFDIIQLGVNRTSHTISYLYLGGINESNDAELEQEKTNEY